MMAMLIAVRTWAAHLRPGRWCARVRSDSVAALGAAVKLRSSAPSVNAVARELALDLAEGLYELNIVEHIPGIHNELADKLSRYFQPGGSQEAPGPLRGVMRSWPAARVPSWWRAAGPPDDDDEDDDNEVIDVDDV